MLWTFNRIRFSAMLVLAKNQIGDPENIVNVSVAPTGWLLVLCLEAKPEDYDAISSLDAYGNLNRFHIHCRKEDGMESFALDPTDENLRFVQPLGDDRWLLARVVAEDEEDRNAHVYGDDGRIIRSLHLGHGISDIQVSEDGNIWVGFADIGIYGDDPISRSGLVCFDGKGRAKFEYSQVVSANIPGMDDCYALNVASRDEVWVYYYPAFSLVRLKNNRVERFGKQTPVSGAKAFAVTHGHALFAGSYDDPKTLFLVALDTMRTTLVEPIDEEGRRILFNRAFARGSQLYLETKVSVFRLDLDLIVNA
jgi:hypothetical protein